jgi:chorismate-pyruvate lyase
VKLANDFDPLEDLMMAQLAKPADLSAVNLRALTPFQRALLVLDGTVTKFIEAYTMEPVDVVRLDQVEQRLSRDNRWLEAQEGTSVMLRQVLIQSKYSRTFYAYAVSMLVLERLPERVRRGVEQQGEGIGRLLNDIEMETRREILWYGKERPKDLPDTVRRCAEGDFVSRTYRIIANRQPIALINEKFPSVSDDLPSHY